jgi:hypothetical protein
MQVSQSYGLTRPAAIAAKVGALRAALRLQLAPVAIEAQTEVPVATDVQTAPQTETRVSFVQLYPHLRESHLKAQRRLFAAIKDAGLSMELGKRMAGTNALLGTNLRSSTGLSPEELHAVADAIERGAFTSDWQMCLADGECEPPLPDAPPEVETAPEFGTPAPLESLDEIAMEFDLAQMRAANRARALSAIYAEKILLETRLSELEHALLAV